MRDLRFERFLKSINYKDEELKLYDDLKFLHIQKSNYDLETPFYTYTIYKEKPRDFNLLSDFLNHLNNITNYQYELVFVYNTLNFNDSYFKKFISDFIINKTFDSIDFNVHLNSVLKLFFSNNEDLNAFAFIKNDLEAFFKLINYQFKIEAVVKENLENINADIKKEEQMMIENEEQFKAQVQESENLILEETKKEITFYNDKKTTKEMHRRSSIYKECELCEMNENSGAVKFKGKVFEAELRETRKGGSMLKVLLGDLKGATYVNFYSNEKNLTKEELEKIKVGSQIEVEGKVGVTSTNKEFFVIGHNFQLLKDNPLRDDHSLVKRVELHLHTNMSEMDGITPISKYCELASHMGMKAIAVTDHGVVQAFPEAQKAAKKYGIKMLYGSELYVIPDSLCAAINPLDIKLKDATYVVFDLETTGLSIRFDRITEFGAVKVQGGMVIDRYDVLINPEREIPQYIVEKTKISNEMVKNCPTMKEAFQGILNFIGDAVLVSHNAEFDYEMFNEAYLRVYNKKFENPVIDTLPLSRFIFPENRGHSLGNLCHRLDIKYDEDSAHRADYDAQVLSDCWNIMKAILDEKIANCSMMDLVSLPYPEGIYKNLRGNHVTVLCKNRTGLKDLYRIISDSLCKYIGSVPLVPVSLLTKYRENLLLGSACFNGDVFYSTTNRNDEDLNRAIQFYDYIEIQPLTNYMFLVNTKQIDSEETLKKYLKIIIARAEQFNKLIVATSDCHYLNMEDKIYRDVYIFNQAVGGGLHPLNTKARRDLPYQIENPDQYFRSTDEMIEEFSWLNDKDKIEEYVITNTNKIADMCDVILPISDQLFTPKIDNCENMLTDLCYEKAYKEYGNPLPDLVANRLKAELSGIIDHGYSVTYYIAHELVRKTNERGYIVGSRGSVGSSFAAYCASITEVNALPPHYRCPHCKHVEFHDMKDGITSGYDLPDKKCPECGTLMIRDGQNIPFETFLGFHADKVPDIDLNFPADFQSTAHLFTKDLLGEDKVFKAGTISAAQFKTAYGYVRKYFETIGADPNKVRRAYVSTLAYGCTEVKRTTGQHPGGIIVVPRDKDIYDFTPVQYPANKVEAAWQTTHFDFNAIHDTILKLDMLGHVDPQALKMMSDLSQVDIKSIPMNDKKVLSLFLNNDALNLKHKYIKQDVGILGIPEFGTNFVRQLVREAKPKSFKDLLIISGLSHGTNVWTDNAQELIKNGTTTLNGVIGCRDDIMTYLISMGLESSHAFNIMETVRKPDRNLNDEQIKDMQEHGVPDFYIDSCKKIKYLFPKGHACAYVMMAIRVSYFKIYYPLEYYATYFTLRCDAYEIETMVKGIDAIHARIEELEKRKSSRIPGEALSNKEENILDTLYLALEFAERGFKFLNIDVNKSMANEFLIDKDNNALLPPFKVLDGIGEAAGESVELTRKERLFDSIADFEKRSKLSKTSIKQLKELGFLNNLKENDELSLFDFAL